MMKKFVVAACLLMYVGGQAVAQSITPELMGELRASWQGTASDRALQNIVTSNSMSTLTTNCDNRGDADMTFTYEVPTHGISDQKQSGRCWLFTGMNVLQNLAMEADEPTARLEADVRFSHVYLSFYDLLEKSNLFLQSVIDMRRLDLTDRRMEYILRNPIGDGGTFTGVADLVAKYGLVPATVMPETYQSENTTYMMRHIKTVLRRSVSTLRRDPSQKAAVLRDVYRILVLCCGEPPREFEWHGQAYTPQQWRDTICPRSAELADYVMIANDPHRPYYKLYEIDLARHLYDGHNWCHLNLPWSEMAEIATRSLQDTTAMYFSCDVGKELERKSGRLDLHNFDASALLGVELSMPKDEAIETYESASSHAMTLVGVAIEDGKPVRWKIENSWGITGAGGHLVATDEWMHEYAYRLVVHKKYLDERQQQMLSQRPVQLPAWDYLN